MSACAHEITGGLTVEGDEVVFRGARARLIDAVEKASERALPGSDAEIELYRALGWARNDKGEWSKDRLLARVGRLPGNLWAVLLARDSTLAADIAAAAEGPEASKRVGAAVLAAVSRAAEPISDDAACDLCREVAIAAHVHARNETGAKPKRGASKAEHDTHARRLHMLAEPMTVEPASTVRRTYDLSETTVSGVRLRGGLLGPRGVVVAPVGRSALAWASLVWRLCLASLAGPRLAAKSSSGGAAERETPMIVCLDGRPVATNARGDGAWAQATAERALRGEVTPLADDEVAQFVARVADGDRLGGELVWLREIAGGYRVDDVPDEYLDLTRRYAGILADTCADDPRTVAVRTRVRPLLKALHRLASSLDQRSAWARAVMWQAREEVDAITDSRESAIVDAWLESPPPACTAFLQPDATEPADPWFAHVATAAVTAEIDALASKVTRPPARRRVDDIRKRLDFCPGDSTTTARALAALLAERDSIFGITSIPCERKGVAVARAAIDAGLGPGECVVLVREDVPDCARDARRRVVRGTLVDLLRAGLEEIELGEGVPQGRWSPPYPLNAEDLLPEATAWAVTQWHDAGCDGSPPTAAEAVRAVREANLPRGRK